MELELLFREFHVNFVEGGAHRNVRHGWLGLDCPWCGLGTRRYHLGVHTKSRSATCWRCGRHGLAESLARLSGESTSVWIRRLKSLGRAERHREESQLQGTLRLPSNVGPLKSAHINYLKGRNFDVDELVRLWKIGGIGLSARLAWSVFIPITLQGETVSWTTRCILKGPSRYVSAKPQEERVSHKTLLYGADHCFGTIVVCEGPTDAWAGGPGVVATLGLSVTRSQCYEIAKYPNRVICFDNEVAAQKRARRLAEDLSIFPGKTSIIEIDAEDLGSAPRKEIRKLRRCVFGD